MFADELDRIDRQMHTRVGPAGVVVAHEEASRWGAYQVGVLARRVEGASDYCAACHLDFLDHRQYIRHRAECDGRRLRA